MKKSVKNQTIASKGDVRKAANFARSIILIAALIPVIFVIGKSSRQEYVIKLDSILHRFFNDNAVAILVVFAFIAFLLFVYVIYIENEEKIKSFFK